MARKNRYKYKKKYNELTFDEKLKKYMEESGENMQILKEWRGRKLDGGRKKWRKK